MQGKSELCALQGHFARSANQHLALDPPGRQSPAPSLGEASSHLTPRRLGSCRLLWLGVWARPCEHYIVNCFKPYITSLQNISRLALGSLFQERLPVLLGHVNMRYFSTVLQPRASLVLKRCSTHQSMLKWRPKEIRGKMQGRALRKALGDLAKNMQFQQN